MQPWITQQHQCAMTNTMHSRFSVFPNGSTALSQAAFPADNLGITTSGLSNEIPENQGLNSFNSNDQLLAQSLSLMSMMLMMMQDFINQLFQTPVTNSPISAPMPEPEMNPVITQPPTTILTPEPEPEMNPVTTQPPTTILTPEPEINERKVDNKKTVKKNIHGVDFIFFGDEPEEKIINDFFREYNRIPKAYRDLLKEKGVEVVITTNGRTVNEYLETRGIDVDSDFNSPSFWKDQNFIVYPETWPAHDGASNGSGSVVTHELGHAVDASLSGNSIDQSEDPKFRRIIDKLAESGKWEWADYGTDSFDLNDIHNHHHGDSSERNYVEIFARAFDDYTDQGAPGRLPFPPELNRYFDNLL